MKSSNQNDDNGPEIHHFKIVNLFTFVTRALDKAFGQLALGLSADLHSGIRIRPHILH